MDIELYTTYCQIGCPYRTNRDIDSIHWQKMEPCLNCPVSSFVQFTEDVGTRWLLNSGYTVIDRIGHEYYVLYPTMTLHDDAGYPRKKLSEFGDDLTDKHGKIHYDIMAIQNEQGKVIWERNDGLPKLRAKEI